MNMLKEDSETNGGRPGCHPDGWPVFFSLVARDYAACGLQLCDGFAPLRDKRKGLKADEKYRVGTDGIPDCPSSRNGKICQRSGLPALNTSMYCAELDRCFR
jgi:hypothetical protein